MSHSAALIAAILERVRADYPAPAYHVTVEARLPGSRLYPDIQITDGAGKVVCVAEIGYTRPEKLTAYRHELLIPDVRWYAKDGALHAHGLTATIDPKEVTGPAGDYSVYTFGGEVACPSCAAAYGSETDEAADLASRDVTASLLTDFRRAWIACYCDACDECWFADALAAAELLFDAAALSPLEFGRAYGRRRFLGPWRDALNSIDSPLVFRFDDAISIHDFAAPRASA
jgi:hypothetical protein